MAKKYGKGRGKSPTTIDSNRIGAGTKPKVTRTPDGKVDYRKFAEDNKRKPSTQVKTTAKPTPVKKTASSPLKGISDKMRQVMKKSTPPKNVAKTVKRKPMSKGR